MIASIPLNTKCHDLSTSKEANKKLIADSDGTLEGASQPLW